MKKCAIALLFLHVTCAGLFGQGLKIEHLTGDFYIFVTYHDLGGKPYPANGMYLVTEDGVAMFDTPWDTLQFQPLLDSIERRHHQPVKLCIATHSHEDRAGGFGYYREKGIATYSSRRTDAILRKNNERTAEFLFEDDTLFTLGKYTFEAYYGGEGHTSDNIVLWFPGERILYGGCLIKSTEATDLGYIKESNLEIWPETLRNIRKKFGKPRFVIPGHLDYLNVKSPEHTLSLLKRHKKLK